MVEGSLKPVQVDSAGKLVRTATRGGTARGPEQRLSDAQRDLLFRPAGMDDDKREQLAARGLEA